ncbi:LamG-like jellyroll fold domain-containing protein [Colwellia sp. UCD-KL20]|uniref:LamG-like jellyroll fold domain-containing protein n=1 Tax=Colwellia sp. UCD-KL20 TaxID=1917165 RepID=UPI0009708853|nr:LamG-like jellyroll fold domain-containing protein [Colwellia sp. UCD-KL20]
MSNHYQLSSVQEKLIAAYLAGEDVADQLLTACQEDPMFLKEVSKLVINDRLLSFELEQLSQKQQFTHNVMSRIKSRTEAVIESTVDHNTLNRRAESSWFGKPWAMAASIAFLVGTLFITNYINLQSDFALVTKIAATSPSEKILQLDRNLGRGEIELSEGYSEIKLNNGVVLVLEAPIKLNLKSVDQVILQHGKLVARVPQNAIGFRIDTPSAEIIDLGTEFGVEVSQNGESQVHVIEGEVKARADNSQSYQHVKKNQALSFNLNNEMIRIKNETGEFMRVLPGESVHNPDFLHWSFDNNDNYLSIGKGIDGKHYLAIDKSPSTEKTAKVEGRFGQALYFNGKTNWLTTDFAGIGSDDPRTVAFWLKVPTNFSRDEAYGIVSWGLHKDYAAWQISPNPETVDGPLGRLRIGTFQAQVVGSTDLRDGQWHHIAVVLYGGEKSDISTHVLLYVDGQLEKTQKKSIAKINTTLNDPRSRSLSLGRDIGYTNHPKDLNKSFFRGGVDELFIVEAALDPKQIKKLMLQNSFN